MGTIAWVVCAGMAWAQGPEASDRADDVDAPAAELQTPASKPAPWKTRYQHLAFGIDPVSAQDGTPKFSFTAQIGAMLLRPGVGSRPFGVGIGVASMLYGREFIVRGEIPVRLVVRDTFIDVGGGVAWPLTDYDFGAPRAPMVHGLARAGIATRGLQIGVQGLVSVGIEPIHEVGVFVGGPGPGKLKLPSPGSGPEERRPRRPEAEPEQAPAEDPVAPTQTITDILAGREDFDTLVGAITTAGVADTLAGDGPFTVFAPTDDAFDALPPGQLDALLGDPDALKSRLLNHVVSGAMDSATLPGIVSVTARDGQTITIEIVDNTDIVLQGSIRVTATDILASNGIIHVIDGVLLDGSGR